VALYVAYGMAKKLRRSRQEPKGAARKRRRTAAQLANEHAAKALRLRSLVVAGQVRRAMELEPQCVPKLLDALKDLGTLGRLGCEPAEELRPVRKNQLALANVPFYDEHAQTPEQALDTPTKFRRGSSLCELSMNGSDASSTRASPSSVGEDAASRRDVQVWVPHCYTTLGDTATTKSGLSEPYLIHILNKLEPVACSSFSLNGLKDTGQRRVPKDRLVNCLERACNIDASQIGLVGQMRHLGTLVDELQTLNEKNLRPLRECVMTEGWGENGCFTLACFVDGSHATLRWKATSQNR
jgi:hypothetical protein